MGARNALHLKLSGCPPGCRACASPPCSSEAKITLGGGTQLSSSVRMTGQWPFLNCPDLPGQGGCRAPHSPGREGHSKACRLPSLGSARLPTPPVSSRLSPLRRLGSRRVCWAADLGYGTARGRRPVWFRGPHGKQGDLGSLCDQEARSREPQERTPAWPGGLMGGPLRRAGRPAGGRGQAPARRARPDVLGRMLAHGVMEHSCWGLGDRGQGPGAKVGAWEGAGGCMGGGRAH